MATNAAENASVILYPTYIVAEFERTQAEIPGLNPGRIAVMLVAEIVPAPNVDDEFWDASTQPNDVMYYRGSRGMGNSTQVFSLYAVEGDTENSADERLNTTLKDIEVLANIRIHPAEALKVLTKWWAIKPQDHDQSD